MKQINIDGAQFKDFDEAITYLKTMKEHDEELAEAKRLEEEKMKQEKKQKWSEIVAVTDELIKLVSKYEQDYKINCADYGCLIGYIFKDTNTVKK